MASGLTDAELKFAVTPAGNPLTESVTLLPNGSVPKVESDTVYCVLPPPEADTLPVVGVMLPVKSTLPTNNVIVVECTSDPLLPIIVIE